MPTQLASAAGEPKDRWSALPPAQRTKQFRELRTGEKADFYLELSAHDQMDLLLDLPPEQRHVWIRLLAPDDAVDVIQEAGPEWRDELLQLLDDPTRREVIALMAYKEDEAGGLMNPRFAQLRPDSTVDEAISYLRKEAPNIDNIYYAYVLDHGQHLLGVVSLRLLFASNPAKLQRNHDYGSGLGLAGRRLELFGEDPGPVCESELHTPTRVKKLSLDPRPSKLN
jgi:magnesium transporter